MIKLNDTPFRMLRVTTTRCPPSPSVYFPQPQPTRPSEALASIALPHVFLCMFQEVFWGRFWASIMCVRACVFLCICVCVANRHMGIWEKELYEQEKPGASGNMAASISWDFLTNLWFHSMSATTG